MISFESDYTTGAHPAILQRLMETNLEPVSGYGTDPYCESARERIRAACGLPEADVEFLVGGTQTNAVVISSMLHDYEGVVAVTTGHVSAHEAGAIEYTGHKVLTIDGKDGKMDAGTLRQYIAAFYADGNHEHMVFPGMVYLSFPTEYGTLYSKAELTAIAEVCHEYSIPLYLEISTHAIDMAETLRAILHECGIPFYLETPTNQQFVILENAQMERLAEKVRFSYWEAYDETHTVVRFATSWSTSAEDLEELQKILAR